MNRAHTLLPALAVLLVLAAASVGVRADDEISRDADADARRDDPAQDGAENAVAAQYTGCSLTNTWWRGSTTACSNDVCEYVTTTYKFGDDLRFESVVEVSSNTDNCQANAVTNVGTYTYTYYSLTTMRAVLYFSSCSVTSGPISGGCIACRGAMTTTTDIAFISNCDTMNLSQSGRTTTFYAVGLTPGGIVSIVLAVAVVVVLSAIAVIVVRSRRGAPLAAYQPLQ